MGLCCSKVCPCCPCCQPNKVEPSTQSTSSDPLTKLQQAGLSTTDQSRLIHGYEKEELLPLEKALQFLNEHIPNLQSQIKLAKENCRYLSKHGLTQDESAAIYLLCMRPDPNDVYSHLEDALNSNNSSKIRLWFKYLKLLKTALDKLPTIKTEVWKGISYDQAVVDLLKSDQPNLFSSLTLCHSSKDKLTDDLSEEPKLLFGYASVDVIDLSDYLKGLCLIWPSGKVNKRKEEFSEGSVTFHYTGNQGKYGTIGIFLHLIACRVLMIDRDEKCESNSFEILI